jgi:anti-sigma regulatory factor (Ser/Thr protein kinase)
MTEKEWSPENKSPIAWSSEERAHEGLVVDVRIVPETDAHATETIDAMAVRKLTMEILRRLGFKQGQRLNDIELVVGEFVANCIEHGGELLEVAIAYDPGPARLHIQTSNPVTATTALPDESYRGRPVHDLPNDEAEGGRGLQLTEALADEWGQRTMGNLVLTHASFYRMQRQLPGTSDETLPPTRQD